MSDAKQPIVVNPEGGSACQLAGATYIAKLSGAQTGRHFDVFEVNVPAQGTLPAHVFQNTDAMVALIDGALDCVVGDQTHRAQTGDALYVSKGTVRSFAADRAPSKLLLVTVPGVLADPNAEGLEIKLGFEIAITNQSTSPKRHLPAPRQYWVLGQHVLLHLGSRETAGNFCVITITMPSCGSVGAHRHKDQDELFYILEGTVRFLLGDRMTDVGPGGLVYVPAGVTHAIANSARTPARILDYHAPGGFESFITECGTECADFAESPPPFDRAAAMSAMMRYGMELISQDGSKTEN